MDAVDLAQQHLFESESYVCTGFQTCRHLHRGRRNILFYARPGRFESRGPLSVSASLPQVDELARLVPARLGLPRLAPVSDSAGGLPLESDLEFREGTAADLQRWLAEEAAGIPGSGTSSGFHLGFGLRRVASGMPIRGLFAARAQKVVAALSFCPDEQDRCVRLIDAFALNDTAIGPLLVVHKSAFTELAQREPHLSLVVLRNIAAEMSHRLRQTNLAVAAAVE